MDRAPQHQVVIVGGGPSGVATALSLIAHEPSVADRVVIVEKHRYPREKLCAGAIGDRGQRVLDRLRVVDGVPSQIVEGIQVVLAQGVVTSTLGRRVGRVVRRIEFDHALARIAKERGIRILDSLAVKDVSLDGIVRSDRGELPASIVVGADGVGSVVRRAMGLSFGSLRAQAIEIDTESCDRDPGRDLLRFDLSESGFHGYSWDFPTVVDGRLLVCRGIYRLCIGPPVDMGDLLKRRLRRQQLEPTSPRRFGERGFVPQTTVVRGPMILVGEAAGVDPLTGEGIPQALEGGELCGAFLAEVLRERRPLTDWQRVFLGSRLGRDLKLRRRLAAFLYGRDRGAAERWLLDSPELLEIGCRHFAGLPQHGWQVTAAIAGGLGRLMRNRIVGGAPLAGWLRRDVRAR